MPSLTSIGAYLAWVLRPVFRLRWRPSPRLRPIAPFVALWLFVGAPGYTNVDGHRVHHAMLTGGWRAPGVLLGMAIVAASYRYWAVTVRPRERREAHRDAQRSARRRSMGMAE